MADPTLFWFGIGLVLITLAGTIYVFRHRLFEYDRDRVGRAANPAEVRRQNPPDR